VVIQVQPGNGNVDPVAYLEVEQLGAIIIRERVVLGAQAIGGGG